MRGMRLRTVGLSALYKMRVRRPGWLTARLGALTEQQKAEVEHAENLVSSVRLMLCGGDRQRLVLADVFNLYELMAYYCKERLDLAQVVYENFAPLATLGTSVRIRKSHVRNSPLIVVPF